MEKVVSPAAEEQEDSAWLSTEALRNPSYYDLYAFLLLAVVTLIDRLPYSFQSVIDWDESTHILLGQYWLEGFVPYKDLYEIKPPGVFALFAALAYVADGSIFVIRLFAALCVLATASFTFKSVRLFASRVVATAAGCLVILMTGALGGSQSAETSLIAAAPLTAGLYLLLKQKRDPRTYFLIGLLFSLATSLRSELGVFVVVISLVIASHLLMQASEDRWRLLLAYIAGGLVLLAVILFVAVLYGDLSGFFLLNVTIPLQYSRQMPPHQALLSALELWFKQVRASPYLLGVFPAFVVLGLTAPGNDRQGMRLAEWLGSRKTVLLIASAGLLAAILVSGEADLRYWSKILPCLAIAGCLAFSAPAAHRVKLVGSHP